MKATALRKDLQSIARDLKQGKARDFHIEIREPELDELLRTDTDVLNQLRELDLRDPYILIESGRVRLTIVREVSGLDLTSTVYFKPRLLPGGVVDVAVDSASIGQLSMPDVFIRRFADRLAEKVRQRISQERLTVKSLRVEPGVIALDGSTP